MTSLPTRGAWIETVRLPQTRASSASLPTRGAWIETQWYRSDLKGKLGRSPHGERGLKLAYCLQFEPHDAVAPHTGSVD